MTDGSVRRRADRDRIRVALLAGYLLLVLVGTLRPSAPGLHEAEALPVLCVVCGARAAADIAVNVALFAPLGFLLGLRRGALWTLAAAAAVSASIEVAQLWIPGRYSVLSDLVFNTVGAGAGLVLGRTRDWWWRPSPTAGATLSVGGAAVVTGLLASAAWLLGPWVPDRPLYGQWTPRFGHLEAYHGRVLDARIGEIPAPDRRLTESEPVRAALEAGAPIRIRFVAGDPPSGLAPVFGLHDDRGRLAVLIGVDGRDLVVTFGRRADAARLDRPVLRLRDGLAGFSAGDTLAVDVASLPSGAYRLSATALPPRGGAGATGTRGFAPGRTWALLFFVEGWSGWIAGAIDLLWLAGLGMPLGWWAPTIRSLGASAAIYVGALAVVPALLPLTATAWTGYAAALAGVLSGAGASAPLPRPESPDEAVSRSAPYR